MTTTSTAQAAAAGSTTTDATMRAAVQRRYAGPEAITIETVARPAIASDEVLIEVHAAGLDRGAWHLATGRPLVMRLMGFGVLRPRQPVVGTDVAGTVVEVGAGVTRVRPGDAVMGTARGSFAEFAVAKQDSIVLKPEALSFAEAAAAPVSGIAAQAAVERAGIAPGDRVLILGAAGGVGSFAVQLAVAAGARVTGVSSAAKADVVRSLGAGEVIDYRATDATAGAIVYDAIIDTGGLTPLRRLRRILSPTGALVIVGGEGGGALTGGVARQLRAALASPFTRQTLAGLMSTTTAAALDRLATRIVAGEARPALTATYPLDAAADALSDLAAGRIAGKAAIAVHHR